MNLDSRRKPLESQFKALLIGLALLFAFQQSALAQKADADIDFGPYMADLQKRVKRAWFPPRSGMTDRVKLVWKIHTDGNVSNIEITSHGDSPKADQAAIEAIKKAAPFPKLPKGAPENVDVEFTFDYNVFKGNNRVPDKPPSTDTASGDSNHDVSWAKKLTDGKLTGSSNDSNNSESSDSSNSSNQDAFDAGSSNSTDSASSSDSRDPTVRVNNLANLEALLNIIANGGEILGILLCVPLFFAGLLMTILMKGRRIFGVMVLLASPAVLIMGLALPGLINWLVASARDAGLFS